ncbi:folate-binding protein YgfZ [Pseudoxanthomonas kalamensis DSM 18571]|nr:folate-binding protein YgfZ [Pseudoxanthomonas kalamensis DSM 18571]
MSLPSGHWQWNAWLTPKGRVIAWFALLKHSEDEILLVLPDMPAESFVAELSRFVLRRKLKLRACAELRVSGSLHAPTLARGAGIDRRDGMLELDWGHPASPRCLRIDSEGSPDDPAALAEWRSRDLRHGLPRLADTQREQWTPQQLSLERLPAFSVKKGCYPGQEIVARTHFLGKAKRGLALFSADATITTGEEVLQGERTVGRIVSATSIPPWRALAVMPTDGVEGEVAAGGIPLHSQPLLDAPRR